MSGRQHTVRAGESIADIAGEYGFEKIDPLWKDAGNAKLRERRSSPWLLVPGDALTIPDRPEKKEKVDTYKKHSFVLHRPKQVLRLKLEEPSGEVLKDAKYVVDFPDGSTVEGTTDAGGLLTVPIPLGTREVELHADGEVMRVVLSSLPPMEGVDAKTLQSAGAARLANLGYYPQPTERAAALRQAIAMFQAESELEVSGELDKKTCDALVKDHGR